MKKVVNGQELQTKILDSIQLLCGTVKETLGPKGNNVLIDHSNFSPFITNDGVTIAKNIESDDAVVAAILEIIKEASIKTNETVGDGTTTTLVLLESLYTQSLEYIEQGENPILLKKELEKTLEIIIKRLNKFKRKATVNDLQNIASISANDEKLGLLAFQVLKRVKYKEAITIKEVPENKTSVSYLKGYTCEISLASPYFLKDTNKINFQNSYILIMNIPITNIESISFILNDILKNKRNLVIIANYFEQDVVENLVSLSLTENISISLLKIEDYGMHVYEVMKDIACITNAKIIDQENIITIDNVGVAKNIEITKDKIRIDFKATSETKKHLAKLKQFIKEPTNDLEKEFYEKRIAMFLKGTAEIKLGAPTKIEGIEKRMRLEDALSALTVCNEGILSGGGVSLLQLSNELNESKIASNIWKQTLKKPFEQILENAGLNYLDIQKKLEQVNYDLIYNVTSGIWEESKNTKVIDPFLVIIHALINATSIACMLLTTKSLIINEYKNSINKENEYNNW